MLTIQCTNKFAENLKMNVSKPTESTNNSIYAWHAHLVIINRHKCVQLMNNQSRYNFIMYGMKKADFTRFDKLIVQAIAENLAADGIAQDNIDKYLSGCHQIAYTASSERSIISQMNEIRFYIEAKILGDRQDGLETDIHQLNRKLNQYVMLTLPKIYSRDTMIDALRQL